jgi:hypothetical protein
MLAGHTFIWKRGAESREMVRPPDDRDMGPPTNWDQTVWVSIPCSSISGSATASLFAQASSRAVLRAPRDRAQPRSIAEQQLPAGTRQARARCLEPRLPQPRLQRLRQRVPARRASRIRAQRGSPTRARRVPRGTRTVFLLVADGHALPGRVTMRSRSGRLLRTLRFDAADELCAGDPTPLEVTYRF